MKKNILILFSLLVFSLLLIQLYFTNSMNFVSIIFRVWYYIMVISIGMLIFSISKFKLLRIYYLIIGTLLVSISTWHPKIQNYQNEKAFVVAETIVHKLNNQLETTGAVPQTLNTLFSGKQVPQYYVFLLPASFEYENEQKKYTLRFNIGNGLKHIYYSSTHQ